MSVQLSSRNFQNSVMGLNSSSKKFPGNVLFRNTEGGADLSKQVEKRLNSSEFYKRNSKVLIPSKDGKSMEVYTVFEDDGSGTVVLTREGAPKKKGEGPEIFMKKVQKSTLLETNPLPVAEKRVEKARSTPSASPEQVAQVEAAAVDRQVERALNTVIDGVDTERGIEEARLALETAGNSSTLDVTRASGLISDQFDSSAFSTNRESQFSPTLSTGDKVSFTDAASSSDRQEPFVSLGQKRKTEDFTRERHNNATTAEDIDVSLAEAERDRLDQDTGLLTPDEMGELYFEGKNDKDEALDLDEDEPHMVLDALVENLGDSTELSSNQIDSFERVISRLPKDEQEAALSKIEAVLVQNSEIRAEAEEDERFRAHNAGEIFDQHVADMNRDLRKRQINNANIELAKLELDAAEGKFNPETLSKKRATLEARIKKITQDQREDDAVEEWYKNQNTNKSVSVESAVSRPHIEAALPETIVDRAEAPKPVAKKKGIFGKIASGLAAAGLALGLASGGGKNIEKPRPGFEPTGPAPAGDLSLSNIETAPPLVSSNVSPDSPSNIDFSEPEIVTAKASVKASASKVDAQRSSPRVSAEAPSTVEIPPGANLENPFVTSIRFNPAENPTFQKLDRYGNTYFNVAENSLYKELGDKVVQLQFNQAGNLSEGYIALKIPGTTGEYNINSKVNFVKGEMFIAGKKAPDVLQDWAKKLQSEYDSYGTM